MIVWYNESHPHAFKFTSDDWMINRQACACDLWYYHKIFHFCCFRATVHTALWNWVKFGLFNIITTWVVCISRKTLAMNIVYKTNTLHKVFLCMEIPTCGMSARSQSCARSGGVTLFRTIIWGITPETARSWIGPFWVIQKLTRKTNTTKSWNNNTFWTT